MIRPTKRSRDFCPPPGPTGMKSINPTPTRHPGPGWYLPSFGESANICSNTSTVYHNIIPEWLRTPRPRVSVAVLLVYIVVRSPRLFFRPPLPSHRLIVLPRQLWSSPPRHAVSAERDLSRTSHVTTAVFCMFSYYLIIIYHIISPPTPLRPRTFKVYNIKQFTNV